MALSPLPEPVSADCVFAELGRIVIRGALHPASVRSAVADEFATMSHIQLKAGTAFERPPELPRLVHLDSPALEVMTDFRIVHAVTVSPGLSIDDALETMKTRGVRLLLVVGDDEEVVGLITARDIQGEKPIKIAQESRIPHSAITVEAVMTPQSSIEVLNMLSVRNAQVGHMVATLRALARQHALVVEVDSETKEQCVRGMFSTTQISKQLGVHAAEVVERDSTLAEIGDDIH
jgi:signal-transduction protein with cAMP-binding, CBS, and nucleotidyltransferase domain